jgi:hypothetical protein
MAGCWRNFSFYASTVTGVGEYRPLYFDQFLVIGDSQIRKAPVQLHSGKVIARYSYNLTNTS